MKKNSIFIQNLRMETQTIFTENGFPKRIGKALIQALLRKEQEEQQAFVKTRREETYWAL